MNICLRTSLVLAVLFTSLAAPQAAWTQTLHYFSVADISDTERPTEFRANKKAVDEFFTTITKPGTDGKSIADLKLVQYDLAGSGTGEKTFNCQNIFNSASNLKIEPDKDIIVFYYSGHGEASDVGDAPASDFPKLLCGAGTTDAMPNLEDIFEILNRKRPRLLIAIADACNNFAPRKPVELNLARLSTDAKQSIYTMFHGFKGSLLIASAKRGELSFYKERATGFFTSRFLGLLTSPPPSKDAPRIWERMLAKAGSELTIPPHQQLPGQTRQHPIIRSTIVFAPLP